ncbi:hypothetical protein HYV64_05620 [Candidatus Shapirobacteria bacterium]|nr:hypothetical protein [Candidatus Shapirobacteria bacterium]
MRSTPPTPVSDTLFKLSETLKQRKKYIKNEFQAFGLQLAEELDDWKNKSLYIRLAKKTDRKLLESALYFVKDHSPKAVRSPARLFMWKLKELKKAEL